MTKAKRDSLREEIAQGFNHGLNDVEIYGQLNGKDPVYPSDLIAIIRDLMTDGTPE
jgi:hypothetical protein